jgi:hypothetical protein
MLLCDYRKGLTARLHHPCGMLATGSIDGVVDLPTLCRFPAVGIPPNPDELRQSSGLCYQHIQSGGTQREH